ncbi:MAG: hypothetical protein ISS82_02075 [Nanoarchaeota archaeon]|nr:hypothetical protein [Nanoarchaeota archaeon]
MKFINSKTIKLDRELNELDKFVLNFIKILKKHTDYVVVSEYILILFGKLGQTGDINVFIKELNKKEFFIFYEDLKKQGYWCLNAEDNNEIYSYLSEGLAVRFALKNQTIPNFEIKFAKKKSAIESLKDTLTVITKQGDIIISSLERQIAYKKYYLKSDKDLEDAKHIEEIFKNDIDYKKIDKYKHTIKLQNGMA